MCSFSLAAHRASLYIDLDVLLDRRPPKPPLEEIKCASITRMARQGGIITPLQDPGRLRDVQASRWTTSWVWLLGLSLSHHPFQFPLKRCDNPRPRNNLCRRLLLCLGRVSLGQGIWFDILGAGSVRQEKLKSVKEQGPSGLPRVHPLSQLDIFQVLVVRENLERVLSPLKPTAPLLQGEFNRKQL